MPLRVEIEKYPIKRDPNPNPTSPNAYANAPWYILQEFSRDINFIDGTNAYQTFYPSNWLDHVAWCETMYPEESFHEC